MSETLIARFSGPLHGVVLRRKDDGTYYTRFWNTQAGRLPWTGGEGQGHYDMAAEEGLDDFCERVEGMRWTAIGDLRVRHEHEERLGLPLTPAEECFELEILSSFGFAETMHDSASVVALAVDVPRCPLVVVDA